MPGPCSRKLCTPIWLSSVRNDVDEQPTLERQPVGQRHAEALVDRPLGERLRLHAHPRPPRAASASARSCSSSPRHHLVGQADAQRLVGLHLAAGDHQLLGPAGADGARQPLRAAAAGDDAEQDLGLAEHGSLAGDAVVARQRQLAAAAERVAADRGDHEPRDRRDRIERRVEPGADRAGLGRAAELG